jgi:hypothetical protein
MRPSTPEQKLSVESRRDITQRRAAWEAAKLNGDAADIVKVKKAFPDQRRRALFDLLLMDAREKYFAEANRLEVEGRTSFGSGRIRLGVAAIMHGSTSVA